MNREEILSHVDHTLLKPEATWPQIQQLCDEAIANHTASVCIMGHSDISVTMNVYTHIGFDDAEEELKRMEDFRKAQAEIEQKKDKPMSQKMFKVI